MPALKLTVGKPPFVLCTVPEPCKLPYLTYFLVCYLLLILPSIVFCTCLSHVSSHTSHIAWCCHILIWGPQYSDMRSSIFWYEVLNILIWGPQYWIFFLVFLYLVVCICILDIFVFVFWFFFLVFWSCPSPERSYCQYFIFCFVQLDRPTLSPA